LGNCPKRQTRSGSAEPRTSNINQGWLCKTAFLKGAYEMGVRSLLFLAILAISIHQASPKDKVLKEKISSGGLERTYYLFVPETLDPGKPAPLLITLHGSGRDGSSLIDPWKKLAKENGIVLAGPDALNSQKWIVPSDGPVFLRDVVESIKARFNIDSKRVYLFGHSAGGVFAIMIAIFEPNFFAAAAVHAGALPVPDQFTPFLPASRRVPIAIWVGDRDPFFPISAVKPTVDFLQNNGFPGQFSVLVSHDHNYYSLADRVNKAAWSFLESKALKDEPEWVDITFSER
jgi:poly(3-hydroxybutyrate) depolymerase